MINVENKNKQNKKYIIVNISQLAMTYILNKYLAYETRKLKTKVSLYRQYYQQIRNIL